MKMEREKRFEPSTLSLATRCSTTELLPLAVRSVIPQARRARNPRGTIALVPDLSRLRLELESLAREAGQMALDRRSDLQTSLKTDGTLVTIADREIESFLRVRLPEILPGSTIWGEEEGYREAGPAGLWLVDPIDGTSNFAYGSPLWGVSIGLITDTVVLGAIMLPDLGELFSAARGQGATLNGQPLAPIEPGPIKPEQLVSYCDRTIIHFGRQLPGKMRYAGAFVVEATSLAKGVFRAVVSSKPALYDIAASICIIRELGGEVRYLDGTPFVEEGVVGKKRIHETLYLGPYDSGLVLAESDGSSV